MGQKKREGAVLLTVLLQLPGTSRASLLSSWSINLQPGGRQKQMVRKERHSRERQMLAQPEGLVLP